MAWNLEKVAQYYKQQGAPGDQNMLIAFLREIQQEHGGRIPAGLVRQAAQFLEVKESFLLALIRRIPSLRLGEGHCLEICAGSNGCRNANLAALAEKLTDGKMTVKYVPCMRLCGKGPNIRWDGKLYHGADEVLLRRLLNNS